MIAPCSCGEAHPHVVSRRRTRDDLPVEVWSDGRITNARSGAYLPGVPAIPVAAIWDLVEVVSLYSRGELAAIVGEVRRFARTVGGRALGAGLGEAAIRAGREVIAKRKRIAKYQVELAAGRVQPPDTAGQIAQEQRGHVEGCRAIRCRRCASR